ncbi:MAG: tetratricopeptide repeat protein [Candidatus Firestonebacteria bacterium]|nr:tetratricopeptide repeat protein [Candidatus Firestonebacteria bacterium]
MKKLNNFSRTIFQFYVSFLLFILYFLLSIIISGCGVKRLPVLDITYDSPKLEITQAEINQKDEEERIRQERERITVLIDNAKNFFQESSTPKIKKYSSLKLKTSENLLAQSELFLKQDRFSDAAQNIEKARAEIITAVEESKNKEIEEKKKEEEERKKKEEEEARKKTEEARKIRERALFNDLIEKAKLKADKSVTNEVNKYLPQKADQIKTLINEGTNALSKEDYKKVKEVVNEVDKLTDSLGSELKIILNKINGEELFNGVKKYIVEKNYGEAYFKIKKYIRDYPDSIYIAESHFLIGLCYEAFDNYDKAKETFNFVINNYPDTEWALTAKDHLEIDLKEKFIKKAEEAKAREKERREISSGKTSEPVKKVEPIQKTEDLKNKNEVIKIYEEALDLLLKKNMVKEAREKLELVIQAKEDSLIDNALYWLGETYYTKQDYKKALEYFNEAINNNIKTDKDIAAQLKIGLSYYNMKDFENALQALKTVQDNNPKHDLNKKAQEYIRIIEKTKK